MIILPTIRTHTEVVKAIQLHLAGTPPHNLGSDRYRLVFDIPVSLRINRRKVSILGKVHESRLFVASGSGLLCHTNTKRTGYPFESEELSSLVSIEPLTLPTKAEQVEEIRNLTNRFHPNAWSDLKVKLLADPESYLNNYVATVTNISRKFPENVIDKIRDAFENKTDFTYDAGGFSSRKTGRDLKVECKMGADGIFRSWFSSEFPGCANGDYWLLVNPTTAIFKERD